MFDYMALSCSIGRCVYRVLSVQFYVGISSTRGCVLLGEGAGSQQIGIKLASKLDFLGEIQL